ncbi:MAG TPA: hypothetical protein VGD22_14965 [Sphingobacteriaceae bacterium]
MLSTINYTILGIFLIPIILFLIFIIRRNNKDRKSFERDLNRSEMEPDQHTDEEHI